MATRLRKMLRGYALGLAGIGLLTLAVPAKANLSLFTTTSDFSGWNNGSSTETASTAYDYDGITTNGAGNNPGNSGSSINVGGTSTGGSLQLTNTTQLGYSVLADSPNLAYSDAFIHALDPGSTTAYSAASGYGSGSTVAYSGILLLTYTVPTFSSGSYYQVGVNFNYAAGGYYQVYFGTAVSDGTVDGYSTFTSTIPYSITAGAGNLSNFQFGIQSNSDYVPTSPIYVDAIQLVTAPVPEPASLLSAAGVACVTLLTRRKRV